MDPVAEINQVTARRERRIKMNLEVEKNFRDNLEKGFIDSCVPIRYRGYKIHNAGNGYVKYEFVHEDYDGPGDNRLGFGKSIEDCIIQINEQIEERILDEVSRRVKFIRVNHGDELSLDDFVADNAYLNELDCQALEALACGEQAHVNGPGRTTVTVIRTR